MTGTTNQIQTPLGSGVQTALGLVAGAAGGISIIPANPNVSVTGTVYGPLYTVWQVASTAAGGYTTPLIVANYDNTIANGTGNTLPFITTINMGNIQQQNNPFSGTLASITSFTATNLVQFSSDFTTTMAALTTLSLPALAYVGGSLSPVLAALTTVSLGALASVNGSVALSAASATTVTLTSLQYVGGAFGPLLGSLTTLSLPAAVYFGSTFTITAANLVTFSIGSTLKSVGGNWTMTGMKLNQASVDGILVSLAALDGTNGTTAYSSKTINLSGGTSSTPSSTGLAAKATLVARSCTVTTN